MGQLVGAQAVYDSLKNYICVDRYSYPTITIKGYAPQHRFLIIDEKERIRNFKELTKNCKKGKSRKGRSWKEQSKRKHQWKNIKNF